MHLFSGKMEFSQGNEMIGKLLSITQFMLLYVCMPAWLMLAYLGAEAQNVLTLYQTLM